MPSSGTSLQEYLDALKQATRYSDEQKWPEARLLWERVVGVNPHVGSFWENLARARYEGNDYAAAILAYTRALTLGSTYPWANAYEIAACHAQAGDRDQALWWLERAFALGLRSFSTAQNEAAFASLHDHPRFRQLVGLADVGAVPRDEGWRGDLALLAREIRRIHYDPFRLRTEEDFEAETQRLHDSIPHLTDAGVYVGLKRLLCMAGDGHTRVRSVAEHPDLGLAAPVQFYSFVEGLFIVATAPRYQDVLGAQVLCVGDHAVDAVMKFLEPVVSRDNAMSFTEAAQREIRYPALFHGLGLTTTGKSLSMTIREPSGRVRTVVLEGEPRATPTLVDPPPPAEWLTVPEAMAPGPVPRYLRNRSTNYWFEYLPEEQLVYFQFNRIQDAGDETIEQFCERLFGVVDAHDVERLVVDLRWNDGGNTFLVPPLIQGLIGSEKINRDGHLFVIVGRRTFSAAQNTATMIERSTRAIFVGEPTGSSPNFVGETILVKLPYSKIEVSISDLYWQTSWPMDHRTWIAPRIFVPPSFESYRANRDPAMEAILGYR